MGIKEGLGFRISGFEIGLWVHLGVGLGFVTVRLRAGERLGPCL